MLSFFKVVHVFTYISRIFYNDFINARIFSAKLRKVFIKTFFTRPSKFRKTVGVYFFSTRLRESFYIDLYSSMFIFYFSEFFLNSFQSFKNLKYSRVFSYSFVSTGLLKNFIFNFYNNIFFFLEFFDLFFLDHFSFNLFFINSFFFF